MAAQLMGYSATRILQDNLLWKPPGAKSIGMHQDGSYADYLVPPEMNVLPNKLADFIRASALTQWFSVPSVLALMAQLDVVRDLGCQAAQGFYLGRPAAQPLRKLVVRH